MSTSLYRQYAITTTQDVNCSILTGNVIPWLRDGLITDSISTYSLSKLENATKFYDYYNTDQVNGVCTAVVYDYTN